jgi:hypothetical protein
VLALVGTLLIGIGAIILAFALSSIGVGPGGGSYPNYTVSLWSPGFTFGALLIGVGIILRGLGVFMTRPP